MTTGCLGQNLGGELVKMLIFIIFNLSGIRRECVLTCMLNIMMTLAFYYFFPKSVHYLTLTLQCVTILLLLLYPEHPPRSDLLGQTMHQFLWVFTLGSLTPGPQTGKSLWPVKN